MMGIVMINGKTYTGNNIAINNNNVIIDGEMQFSSTGSETINVIVNGDVGSISCNGAVTVDGVVNGDIDCGGSCKVGGDVKGNIDCGGSCSAMNVTGSIDAGGSVRCTRN